jgi:hypothetical protein
VVEAILDCVESRRHRFPLVITPNRWSLTSLCWAIKS